MVRLEPQGHTNTEIFELLMDRDELNWRQIIMELIRDEAMNPWDIDVQVIAEKFLSVLDDMKDMDFQLTGKIVFAAAYFLKIKSDRLLEEDIEAFDTIMFEDEFEDDYLPDQPMYDEPVEIAEPRLVPRTPQPRKRKVSVNDLARALEKALAKEQRRFIKKFKEKEEDESDEPTLDKPEKTKDISLVIEELYDHIKATLQKIKAIQFSQLLRDDSKEHKVRTFVPLLHLENQRKIDLIQEEHFGDIEVNLARIASDFE